MSETKNTKRARCWAFTVSKPTEEQLIHFEQPHDYQHMVDWGVFALERGDQNLGLHIQGCIRFKNAKTWSSVRKILWLKAGDELAEFRSTPAANVAYCMKGAQSHEEWVAEGVDGENYGYQFQALSIIGEPPKYGEEKKNQWDSIREAIENGWTDLQICARWPQEGIRCAAAIQKYRLLWDRAHADWRDVEVLYIHGATGTGKTRSITQKYGYPNCYRITNYNSGAWDMYAGQDVVIFEEFRSSFRLEQMLNYLDGHPVEVPCRYANQLAKFTKVFILTNIPLSEQYPKFQDDYASEGMKRSWAALERRICGCIEVKEGETLSAEDLPVMLSELDSLRD